MDRHEMPDWERMRYGARWDHNQIRLIGGLCWIACQNDLYWHAHEGHVIDNLQHFLSHEVEVADDQ